MKSAPQHDVVVIGSGAGGGAVAWALAQHGVSVLVLEAGPQFDPLRDYLLHTQEWEQQYFPDPAAEQQRYTFGPLQELSDRWKSLRSWNHLSGLANPANRRVSGKYWHVRGVGGTTLHYTGSAHRMLPASMNLASRFDQGSDWPISYEELEPYYCQAERVIGVAGPLADPLHPRSEPYPLPAHPISYASTKFAAGCRKLGLNWDANSVGILSQPYDGRPGCNYCANCSRGCPRLDKGSVDVTFLKKARATGKCTIQSGCHVTRLEAGADDRIERVEYVDQQGQSRSVAPKAVVVSCGAVETPRLLLLSENQHARNGLANESGQVGRNFMETLFWGASGLHPEPLASYRGIPADSICWDFNAPDAIPNVVGGCVFSPGTAEADLLGPISYATRVVPGWGREHKAELRRVFGRALAIKAIGESLPNEKSFIALDPQLRDRLGQPLAQINSFLPDSELTRLQFMAQKAREILNASGVQQIFEESGSYDTFSSTHVAGTCRMGDDPEKSVVDSFGGSHRWRNLFVADASVLPSIGGGIGPSLTIEALALRTGERLQDQANRQKL